MKDTKLRTYENDLEAKRLIEDSRLVNKFSSHCEFYIRKSKEIGEVRSNGIWSKSRIEKREQRLYEFFTELHRLGKEYKANRETYTMYDAVNEQGIISS